jgi:hypothetical protein
MKKIGIITLLTALIIQGFSQEVTAGNNQVNEEKAVAGTNESTKVVLGNDKIIIQDDNEGLNIRMGNRGLSILESLEGKGPKIEFKKFSKEEDNDQESEFEYYQQEIDDQGKRSGRSRFKGHWSGIEFGFNNYITSDRSLSLPAEADFMTLHSGKSSNLNVNISQLSLGFTRRIGLVTGLGINWNNYRFDGNNNIIKGANGVVEVLAPAEILEKSKLTTMYLNVPVLLELQIPVNHDHLNLSAGVIGGVKVGSHTKMVFEGGDKVKSDGDFSLNMLRYGMTARVGYENFQFFGTCYNTPLFKSGKSPEGVELFPFEIGLSFTFND